MVLDPMSALSIAAAAVQFVDFARVIVCKSKDLYRSTDGVLQENKQTETVTMRLKELAKSVEIQATPRPSNSNTSSTNPRLQIICTACSSLSTELLEHLHQLKVPENAGHRKWKSFRQALKSVWSKRAIDNMAEKFSNLRAELDTEVLILLRLDYWVCDRENFASMSLHTKSQLKSLDNKTQTVTDGLLDSNSSLQDFFRRFGQLNNTERSIFKKLGLENMKPDKQFRYLDVNTQHIIELLVERRSNHDNEIAESRQLLKEAREAAARIVERDNMNQADGLRRVKLSILDGLRFVNMTHRPESISSPHEATFHWIFKDSEIHQKPWDINLLFGW